MQFLSSALVKFGVLGVDLVLLGRVGRMLAACFKHAVQCNKDELAKRADGDGALKLLVRS